MKQADRTKAGADPAKAAAADPVMDRLIAIEEQGRQTLDFVRSLIGLMLPAEGREGPRLEDLLATVVVQQREATVLLRAIQQDVTRVADHLLGSLPETLGNGHDLREGNRR